MNIDTKKYNTWDDFKHFFIKDVYGVTEPVLEEWIFRGQNSDSWNLVASFDRKYHSLTNKMQFETDMIDIFKNMLVRENCLKKPIDKLSESEIRTLAQHHGMPTILLDWSFSPYVAAFFAFSGPAPISDTYVTIFALNTKHTLWNGSMGCKIVHEYTPDNEHQKKQSGVFTELKHTAYSLEDYVSSYNGSDMTQPLIRMLIPKTERQKAVKDLKLMRISYESIYSGLESFAKSSEIEAQMKHNLIQI